MSFYTYSLLIMTNEAWFIDQLDQSLGYVLEPNTGGIKRWLLVVGRFSIGSVCRSEFLFRRILANRVKRRMIRAVTNLLSLRLRALAAMPLSSAARCSSQMLLVNKSKYFSPALLLASLKRSVSLNPQCQ